MRTGESFREYFRRARTDPRVRAELLENARFSRMIGGWLVLAFGIIAMVQTVYQLARHGIWISGASVLYTFLFVIAFLIYDKFGDRIAVLSSMDDADPLAPAPKSEPVLPPGGI
jgi:uncharacterized ion transporter superfamily protein YfcC